MENPVKDHFPYFAEYPAPWLHDTDRLDLTLEQLGAVFLLRCYAWVNEDSSLKKSTLGKLLRVTPAKLRKLLPSVLPLFKDEGERIAVEEFREQKVSLLN